MLPSSNQTASEIVPDPLRNPAADYNVGWSHVKEGLKSGQCDLMKVSYYAIVMSSYLNSVVQSTSPDDYPTCEVLNGLISGLQKICFPISARLSKNCAP